MNTKIKLKVKNVPELLKLLEVNGDSMCALSLDLNVSKSVIKILDNYSEDWDFTDELEPVKKEQPIIEEIQKEEYTPDNEATLRYYTNTLGIKSYNEMATLVEAILKMSKSSPGIAFGSGLFENVLTVEYKNIANSDITIEHSLLAMIIETYYKDANIEDALEDTTEKLRGLWVSKELSEHPNTTSVSKILYGTGKKGNK